MGAMMRCLRISTGWTTLTKSTATVLMSSVVMSVNVMPESSYHAWSTGLPEVLPLWRKPMASGTTTMLTTYAIESLVKMDRWYSVSVSCPSRLVRAMVDVLSSALMMSEVIAAPIDMPLDVAR